ncbi:GAP family protein [Streptomyces sp. WAC01280]|uniref:GAP family protein n=1 Tax=Streptomyces sp. WAC01280 TaxID=2487424 RepID=UPI000F7747EB|nr:GAP family protein [Streptomyces sp. WAC01280]RSS53321.1 GAP family protein [Streptomyces sp. WAC01280]
MILDLFLIGLAIALYPIPVMAFVLVVSAPRGVYKGLAFIIAWLACLVAVIAMVLLFTGGQPPAPRSPPSIAALAATLVIGLSLIVYSEHRRRRSRRTAAAPASQENRPKGSGRSLTSRMDQATGWSAAGLAVLLQPWGMVSAAAATVVKADLSQVSSFLALFGFCVLATAGLLAMELYMVFAPEKAQHSLVSLRGWLERHKDPAIVLICLVLGLWLVGRSLYQLTG